MKALTVFTAVSAFASAWASEPRIVDSHIDIAQAAGTRVVTVSYSLENEPAVVTAEFFTNGVALTHEVLTSLSGDVARVVEPGAGVHRIEWTPYKEPWGEFRAEGLTVKVTAWPTNSTPDYMVVHLREPYELRYYVSEDMLPLGIGSDAYLTDYLVMRRIHAANVSWMMGSPEWETGRTADLETPHEVTLTNDYYIGVFEMTRGQYSCVTNMYPGYEFANYPMDLSKALLPAVGVHYYDHLRPSYFKSSDVGFTGWPAGGHNVPPLSFFGLMRGTTGLDFDLPTEAEWEFACRAGTQTTLCNGDFTDQQDSRIGEVAWDYWSNYRFDNTFVERRPGLKKPNAWGIYDMHGNVAEWCLDRVDTSKPMSSAPVIAPVGDTTSTGVVRGGWYMQSLGSIRCAARKAGANWWTAGPGDVKTGFRVVCRGGLE